MLYVVAVQELNRRPLLYYQDVRAEHHAPMLH